MSDTQTLSELAESPDSGTVPSRDPNYVPFGYYDDIKTIIKSEKFYPVYITGLSGNGKTLMVRETCAELGRKLYRVNITQETDEDDLFGGFRLVDGETVWFDGPVIKAMKTGSVLLLDEVDLASTKIMCLQPVLEGNAVLLKKINKIIKPEKGFNILATANTKGRGSDDGKFVGTTVLNEAFLERFPITIEQQYPEGKVEQEILEKVFKSNSVNDPAFITNLVRWAGVIRKTAQEQAVDEIVTTRRLVHIAHAYAIFRDKMKAIKYCLNRFDGNVKDAFIELYARVDESIK
jgi:MoxR-like ATPase